MADIGTLGIYWCIIRPFYRNKQKHIYVRRTTYDRHTDLNIFSIHAHTYAHVYMYVYTYGIVLRSCVEACPYSSV